MIVADYSNITPTEAVALQRQLRDEVTLKPLSKVPEIIAGADISFNKFSDVVYAGIVVFSYPDLTILEKTTMITQTRFPYVPGLLGFREVPALVEVWNKLEAKPDVLILDGHGIAHPRRLGIATHFGIIANTPTIGCAKTLLTGVYEEPGNEQFALSPLIDKTEEIGVVFRTKQNCNPVFISPGHLITMDESISIIKSCVGKYRIPEPTRLAHLLVNEIRVLDKK